MEIEIRAFITDLTKIEKKIISIGAKFESESHIIDYWFCKNDAKNYEEVKMDHIGSYGLRLRKEIKKGKERFELNCKVLENESDHNAFHEFESEISDIKQCEAVLEHIGFKKFCTVDKKRRTYKLKNCLINIEEIRGFNPAIEFEIIDNKNVEVHKKFITDTMQQLGIKNEDIIKKSITQLYMKEFSKF